MGPSAWSAQLSAATAKELVTPAAPALLVAGVHHVITSTGAVGSVGVAISFGAGGALGVGAATVAVGEWHDVLMVPTPVDRLWGTRMSRYGVTAASSSGGVIAGVVGLASASRSYPSAARDVVVIYRTDVSSELRVSMPEVALRSVGLSAVWGTLPTSVPAGGRSPVTVSGVGFVTPSGEGGRGGEYE